MTEMMLIDEAPKAERLKRNAAICQMPDDDTSTMLRKAITAQPDDIGAVSALTDHYISLGESRKTADVWVSRSVRWGRVRALLAGDGRRSAAIRARSRAGCDGANNVPIKLVGNERAAEGPKCTGEAPRSTFRKGGVCQFPGAAIRAGYKVDYHPDTRSITVGVAYIEQLERDLLPGRK